jgi:hypothetical protein
MRRAADIVHFHRFDTPLRLFSFSLRRFFAFHFDVTPATSLQPFLSR